MSNAVSSRDLEPREEARSGVAIGYLDTGVDASHPALRGKVSGFLYVGEDGVPEPERASFDSGTHGTHTAAIIGSIAPEARLYCASVIEGGKTPVRILAGLEWLLDKPIRILHLPLGLRVGTPLLLDVIDAFRDRGVLPIAAVGNEGSSKHQSPGGYDRVLSVGACHDDGTPARFSGSSYFPGTDRCHKPDVLAPGVDILSASPGGAWLRDSGTSMACAHVAGVAASLWQAKPEASVDEIEAAIVRTASPLSEDARHRCRAGIADPAAALRYLLEGRHAKEPPRSSPPPRSGAKFVDPRLGRKLTLGFDDDEIEALIVLRRERGEREDHPLPRLVERCARALGSPSPDLRLLHRGSIGMLRAPLRLLSEIIAHPSIAAAQSTEVDIL